MIVRNTNSRNYVENLNEAVFVGSKGINATKPCTSTDTVVDITNFDIDPDGGLSLRKPLIWEDTFHDHTISEYIYTQKDKIYLTAQGTSFLVNITDDSNPNKKAFLKLKYTKYTGEVVESEYTEGALIYGYWQHFKIINTGTSTILAGILVENEKYNLIDPDLLINPVSITGPDRYEHVYRYLRIYSEGKGYCLEIINPESNMLTSADSAVLNPNLTLEYSYAIRDNYNATSVGVSNILAYAMADLHSGTPNLYKEKDFTDYTVQRLTESLAKVSPRILSSITKDSAFPVCLKAFVDVQPSKLTNCICLWEKTFDGIVWEEVPEFTESKDYFEFEVPDPTAANETLKDSGTYTKVKKCRLFNPQSSKDLVSERPDCLILNAFDNATYRFTIYSISKTVTSTPSEESVDFKNIIPMNVNLHLDTTGEILGGALSFDDCVTLQNFYGNTDYYRVDTPIFNDALLQSDFVRYFKIVIKLDHLNVLYDSSKFKVRILDKNNLYTHTLTTSDAQEYGSKFKDESLSYGLKFKYTNDGQYSYITLAGAFPIDKLYSFYEMCPTLIKLYYDDALYSSFKVMFNRYRANWEPEGFILMNLPIHHNGIMEQDASQSTEWLTGIPYPTDALEHISYTKSPAITRYRGAMPKLLGISKVSLDMLPEGYNLGVKYRLTFGTVLKTDDLEQQLNLESSNYFEPAQVYRLPTWTFDSDVLVLKNYKTESYECIVLKDIFTPDLEEGAEYLKVNMNIYMLAKNTSDSQNLPDVFNEVEVSDPEPYVNKFVEVQMSLGFTTYTFNFTNSVEFVYSDVPNAVTGEKLYYKKAIYTYGKAFGTNIYPTYTDSFITPLFNVIDLDVIGSSYVTTVVPWRDYLVATTENTVHLITRSDGGFYTKTINSFIGIPFVDRQTCKSILNGIIFKSGTKVYSLVPNNDSGDDTILNISELSGPIEGLIPESYEDNFALTTETAYYLFIPQVNSTVCFKYEYYRRIWTKFVYPVKLIKYKILNVEDIRVYSESKEFHFGKHLKEVHPSAVPNVRYGDYLNNFTRFDVNESYNGFIGDSEMPLTTPIEYYFNSGQKTDQMSTTKQFKESKIILATLDDKSIFPFKISINIDGTAYTIHKDANTNGMLWKTSESSVGATGMTLTTSNTNLFNIIRQMYIRYSGRGKTVQHIISGISYFNFKLYMVKYRYRIVNVKQ